MGIIRKFAGEKRGAAAVEFALVSGIFITTILFIMYVALVQYLNQALDFATARAARQIMTGYVQKNSIGQTKFRTGVVCPNLPAALSCNNVIINVQTIAEAGSPSGYYQLVNSGPTALLQPVLTVDANPYVLGVQQSYVYLQIVYPITFLPQFLVRAIGQTASYNGTPALLISSTAAFKNEQY